MAFLPRRFPADDVGLIILLKLFVLFVVLRLFFFPDFLYEAAADGDKGGYVGNELIERAVSSDLYHP